MRYKFYILSSLFALITLLLIACLAPATPQTTSITTATPHAEEAKPVTVTTELESKPVEPLPAAVDSINYRSETIADALDGKLRGTVVTIMGPFTDQDEVKFVETLKPFEQATGIDIQYTGSKEFEATISTRIEGGDAPDIASIPQPGLLRHLAAAGLVLDVSTFLPIPKLQEQYIDAWIDMSRMPGPDGKEIIAGVWERFNGKSLVWYPKQAFDKAGYKVPKSWQELLALQDQIVEDGGTPWCIGIESGGATGWPATDWMEEFMLRTTSLAHYDQWVSGQLKFHSPEVKAAAAKMSEIWLNEKYVYGGSKAIATTSFADAATPMFQDPPKCWLHKQANFITSFFPQDKQPLIDYDVFYLPPIDPQSGKPFLVAGDIMAVLDDRPEVRVVMEYFTTAEHLKGWLATGGVLSPHKDVDLSWYGNDLERAIAKLTGEATSVRFDASDLMPREVGSDAFWKGMTSYVLGTSDLDTTLKGIDAAWPKK